MRKAYICLVVGDIYILTDEATVKRVKSWNFSCESVYKF